MDASQGKILTVAQTAKRLQVTEKTLCDWLRAGKVPGRKIGRVWRISEDALEDFLRGGPVGNSRGANSNNRKRGGREQRRPVEVR
jgi:excisionase family DNA binding protein